MRYAGLAASLMVALAAFAPDPLSANPGAGEPRHGLSAFGDLKYKADFKHFDYVNPDAPKGGRLTTVGSGALTTFDSFNPFILKGDAAQGITELTFDTLMIRAMDEPDSYYGLLAESVVIAPDRLSATFKIRAEAKFSNGQKVTADDAVFSFTAMKEKGHPVFRLMLADVVSAEATDPATVRFNFQGTQIRSLPATVASLPILSKAQFATRAFDESGLEPLIGSGPYKIGDYKQGTFLTFARRADYWAKGLPVMRGRFNFDEVRYEYFKERIAGIEAIKAGLLDVREEFTSKDWMTAYEIPAVAEKKMILEMLPDMNPSGTQGFWINTRRAKFQDIRVRRALDLAFDYEWTNKNLFYGLYKRTTSFFENSSMKAEGKPGEAEVALLAPFKEQLPAQVFDLPYVPPVSDASGNDRRLMREAAKLFADAGWQQKGPQLVNAKGEPFEIEFMIRDATSERLLAPYVKNLQALGIATTIRKVDPAQYERRQKAFDFDILSARFTMSLTPGPELRSFYGSEAAATDGSLNLSGIKNPVVDELIKRAAEARTRADLITATRALDRVLRVGHYWVPHWYKASHSVVYWDKFGRPPLKPAFDRGITDTWWFDGAKAAKLKAN
jgi:microcin C transport system substrate-binding protein